MENMDDRVDIYDMRAYHESAIPILTKQQLSDEMDVYLSRFQLPLPVAIRLCFDRTIHNERTLNYYRGYLNSFSDINRAIALGIHSLNINQHGKINCALLRTNPMRIYELYNRANDKSLLWYMPTDFKNAQGPDNQRTPLIELLKLSQKSTSELVELPGGLHLLQVVYSPQMLHDLLSSNNRDSINQYFGRTLIQFNAIHKNLDKILITPSEKLSFYLTFHDLSKRLPELTGENIRIENALIDAAVTANSNLSAIQHMISILDDCFKTSFPDVYTQYERLSHAGLLSGIHILEVMATPDIEHAAPLPDDLGI